MSEIRTDARMSERPVDLPDFTNPPVIEVLIDTQFESIPGYSPIYANDVWDLFRDSFPKFEEQRALLPSFETFGSAGQQQIMLKIKQASTPPRFWFLSENGDHLIQFQSDRFIRNWRKNDSADDEYPRFESIMDSYSREFSELESYISRKFSHTLAINQCEVRYVNSIPIEDLGGGSESRKFLRFGDFGDSTADDFLVRFRRTIREESGEPIFRLVCECGSARTSKGELVLKLDILARGAPKGTSLKDAQVFCLRAREKIVRLFTEITTEYAHKIWGRVK